MYNLLQSLSDRPWKKSLKRFFRQSENVVNTSKKNCISKNSS